MGCQPVFMLSRENVKPGNPVFGVDGGCWFLKSILTRKKAYRSGWEPRLPVATLPKIH